MTTKQSKESPKAVYIVNMPSEAQSSTSEQQLSGKNNILLTVGADIMNKMPNHTTTWQTAIHLNIYIYKKIVLL